ncbi:small multidrug resistance pump [Saccharopolyspora erythraea NRRL 2338]|uniref:Small multidrug resistance protein, SMR family n=2 Tax=Saccharopolyspora erythraea TaxID=1836 RepID=A4F9R2_SACEN|nr:multidrug efflux SMR transporter [Saccharopolyspora erythraea]EQD84565.1 multidrug transporter [Saccharopolyspora erythraea D]PFG94574.1 small multidrug resistance pump [Saccharopolyspora erythraea NRRL 2338]QRK91315.1 multidrug efflux SMR transporter [Saccharopolyspora erythraea]CAM00787.1 small multidrug resistance protein, SMR family [Saccharopolyspora erythraea NRRL 2338]
MAYLLLLGAVASEVVAALATRFSAGFTKLVPSAVAITGVVGAYYLLSLALKQGMDMGVAYGIWAALGVTAVALVGAAFLGDTLTWAQMIGIVLVIGGVLSLELGGQH